MEADQGAPRRVATIVTALVALQGAFVGATAGPDALPPIPTWTEEAVTRGIDFVRAGDDGSLKFLTVVGGGACFADFDDDGYPDLFLVNQFSYDADYNAANDVRSRLYRNNADGTFTDVTDGSGVGARTWGNGCGVGDYDADGDLDLALTAYGMNSLFRNDGDFRFTNVTQQAGVSTVGLCPPVPCWGQAATFGDLDGDACLDLYFTNYVAYDDDTGQHGHNGPEHYDGQRNLYFRSRCDGTFEDRTNAANLSGGVGPNRGKSFQALILDYDGDGDQDVYIANDMVPNALMRNNGDGTFTDVADEAGVADARAGMGADAQDVDGDGWPDLYFTHYHYQTNGFYANDRDGTFTDHSGTGNLSNETCCVGWGTVFLDFDADGHVDILAVNGHTRDFGGYYDQERQLYRRNPAPTFDFTDERGRAGFGMSMESVARGLAMADFDYNGALDFLVLNTGATRANLLVGADVPHGWLQVQLRQEGPNGRALGATVTVTPDGLPPVTRIVRASASFLSQHGEMEHFGMGAATSARLDVRWPDGATETWRDVGPNQVVRLTRGDPVPRAEIFPPRTTATRDVAPNAAGWHRAPVTVSLSAVDRGVTELSGVDGIAWRLDGGAWGPYDAPIAIGEGVHRLDYRARDLAGNEETARRDDVRVDLTPPASALAFEGLVDGWAGPASRLVLGAEDALSGPEGIRYRYAGESGWRVYGAPLVPEGEGRRTLEWYATDVAGNAEEVRAEEVPVDVVAPTLDVAFLGPMLEVDGVPHVTGDSRVVLEVTDGGSGVAAVEYAIGEGPWVRYDGPFALVGEDGPRILGVRGVDGVGNAREMRTKIVLDQHRPPAIEAHAPRAGRAYVDETEADAPAQVALLAGRVRVSALAGPDVSGNAWTRVIVDGVVRAEAAGAAVEWTWDAAAEAPGPHRVEFEAEDGLGNAGRVGVDVVSVPWGVLRAG